jgi:MFS family permease
MMVLKQPPVLVGGLLAPMLIGITVGAVMFRWLLPTRWLPLLVLGGLGVLAVAAAALLALDPATAMVLVPVVAVLLGFGAGAAVAPGLFMAGLSVPSSSVGPTFALVELLRSEAAFILAPLLSYVAMTSAGSLSGGILLGIGVTFGLIAIVSPVLIGLLLLGGVGPHAPDLEAWVRGDDIAYDSPRIAAAIRGR